MESFYIGVDVGTGSARAGVFDATGRMLGTSSHNIATYRPAADFVEQSSNDIWHAVCASVKQAIKIAGVERQAIHGIGFDATCSLVVLDEDFNPVSVSPSGSDDQNIIVWMDHRAIEQADRINRSQHQVLKYVGGAISPEMQVPKLLWLKENLPATWQRAAHFFDLPDYLTFRATGATVRSLCSLVCKWTFLGHAAKGGSGWADEFFEEIGLNDLVVEGYARVGKEAAAMGSPIAHGVSQRAAAELCVETGTAVGVSMIDAHAGGIGVLGATLETNADDSINFNKRMALISGTSTCHMAVSEQPRFIHGIWGPYFSAMVPKFWLNEGGQSATGSLIDHVIQSHAAYQELKKLADSTHDTVYGVLNKRLERLASTMFFPAALTKELHVCPYFHGNRSPWADSSLKGMVSGLTLSATLDDLAIYYLATIQAVAYGTKHIIDELNKTGYAIDTIFACGGGLKNPVLLREHADITGCRIVLAEETESVLLGSAMLGAVAAGAYSDIPHAMRQMSLTNKIVAPAQGPVADYHCKKYQVFLGMHDDQLKYRSIMESPATRF